MVKEFRAFWPHYVVQSLLATLAVFAVLCVLSLQEAVIIASIGASVFVVFAMPNNVSAAPRNLVGGHVVGLLSGCVWSLVPHASPLMALVIYSLAVGCATFVMVVVDVEHPPAAGTALGVAIRGPSVGVTLAVVTSAIVLSLIHHYSKPYLKDLV